MSELLNIKEVAELLDCSESTVRIKVKKKSIPQPLKRKSNGEAMRWRKADINKFLGKSEDNLSEMFKLMEKMMRTIARQEAQLAVNQERMTG